MTRPPRASDLYDLRVPTGITLSPDGGRVAFSVKSPAPGRDGYRQALWIAPADGSGAPRRVTLGVRRDHVPAWSTDGTSLAFLSDRGAVFQAGGGGDEPGPVEAPSDGGTQVWLLPLDGGEARQLTRLPHDAKELAWSPDGRRLCVVSTSEVAVARPKAPRPPDALPESDYRFIDRLQYQDNLLGFVHDRFAKLWLIDVETGAATRLTGGRWNDHAPAWSPDGGRIAFVSRRHRDADLDSQSNVFVVDVASGRVEQVTGGRGRRTFADPTWSPDGAWLAVTGYYSGGRAPTRPDVWRFPAQRETEGENLTAASELHVGASMNSDLIGGGHDHLGWSADGRSVAFAAPVDGSVELWRVSVETRMVERLTAGRHYLNRVHAVATPDGGLRFAMARADATSAMEVVVLDVPKRLRAPLGPEAMRPITDLMRTRLADVTLVEPAERWHEVDGRRIQGWFYPAAPRDGRPAPLVVQIHGGPATLYGWSLMWEWQVLVAQGMSVYACNPRGSEGYGQEFLRANLRDWGHGPMRDVMGGVDALVADGLVDEDRMGVTGGSYGGYLTSWIVGHTDRFKAAVTCRSVNDLTSEMLSGDIGGPMFGTEEYGVNPWEDHELFWSDSPIAHARSIRTPLLIQHAERDLRVPITQAEELFSVLRALRRPVRLMRVPDESHELTRSGTPFRRVENVEQIAAWFRHFLVQGKKRLPPLPHEKRVRR